MLLHHATRHPSPRWALGDHPCRARIMDAVGEAPGMHVSALARTLRVSYATTMHHLRVLERRGLLVRRSEGSHSAIYLTAASPNLIPPQVARSPSRLAIFTTLERHPDGLTRASLRSFVTAFPERTRNHALQQLLKSGLLVVTHGEGGTRFVLAPGK